MLKECVRKNVQPIISEKNHSLENKQINVDKKLSRESVTP